MPTYNIPRLDTWPVVQVPILLVAFDKHLAHNLDAGVQALALDVAEHRGGLLSCLDSGASTPRTGRNGDFRTKSKLVGVERFESLLSTNDKDTVVNIDTDEELGKRQLAGVPQYLWSGDLPQLTGCWARCRPALTRLVHVSMLNREHKSR